MINAFVNRVGAGRAAIERDLQTISDRRYFSPVFYSHYEVLLPVMIRYVNGRLIDLGCGTAPFYEQLAPLVDTYHGVDIWPRSDKITYVGDVRTLSMVPDHYYHSGICIEVLEHLSDPFEAACAIYRILKPGGVLVASVPHLSRLHDIPHDYFRFTCYGIRHVLESAGFEILETHAKGGLFSFLGHQLSTILLSLCWSSPVGRPLAWWLNKWLVSAACFHLDRVLRTSETFALGYVIVARRPVA